MATLSRRERERYYALDGRASDARWASLQLSLDRFEKVPPISLASACRNAHRSSQRTQPEPA